MAIVTYQQPMIVYTDEALDTEQVLADLVADEYNAFDEQDAAVCREYTIVGIEIDDDRDVVIRHRITGSDDTQLAWVHSDEYDAQEYPNGVQFENPSAADESLSPYFQAIGLKVGL